MNSSAITISAVLPMYNEEANIEKALTVLDSVLCQITSDYEIIVVNDASTDFSPQIVTDLISKNARIVLLQHAENKRLGATLRTGFEAAQKECILYLDADIPFDMAEIKKAVRLLHDKNADIISAYRHTHKGEGVKRVLYSCVYNLLIRFLFGLRVRDVNFCFKLFRRELLESFPLRSEGSFIDAELLINAFYAGKKIVQFGTDYFPRERGVSQLSSMSVIGTIILEMIDFRMTSKANKKKVSSEND